VPDSPNTPFTEAELAFFRALDASGTRYVLVGLAAAVAQGADTVTQDLDLWFPPGSDAAIAEAARAAGGFYSSRMEPPMIGGPGLDRVDVVTHCDGLDPFDEEYARTVPLAVEDIEIRMLDLERVLASKAAADRPKDRAVIESLRAALVARNQRP
jgi:hypothetical protein